MKPVNLYNGPTMGVKCNFCNTNLIRKKSYVLKRQEKRKQFFCNQICQSYNEISPKHSKMMDYINDSNFYYLIGLISTDGHIDYPQSTSKSKVYYAVIKLNCKDEELLIRLCEYFGGKLYYENNKKTVCYRIFNPDFIKYLINDVGLTNNKTYNINIEKWFQSLCKNHKEAFILGCFDGDGCLKICHNRQYALLTCYICSASIEFLKMLQNYINVTHKISGNLTEVKAKQHNSYNSIFTVKKSIKAVVSLFYYNLNGNSSKIICNMYDSANHITMKRKYVVSENILQFLNTKKKIKNKYSEYKGVFYNSKCNKKWSTKIIHNGITLYGSRYSKEITAAIVYDIMCLIFKKGLFLNFLNNLENYKKIIRFYNIDKNYNFKNLTEHDLTSIMEK